ncbi:cation diffusion facilitator family transporter [Limnochorda pilosa]|uniref:Cation transporter n=1 Tax=Limnochorda pilosa TaxID=1555112 RepID=A0A0K2SL26_LIMPI|nr:cation diffusion facilitator family transporter [Limnochorda pilosa]BAS27821.1 cation transporter [Limnochorda pilosa]
MDGARDTGAQAQMRAIRRVLWVVLLLNWAVASAKLLVGSWIRSASMVADGFHSFSDGASNVVGLVGVSMAAQPSDPEHPYGHKKFETFASLVIGFMLVFVLIEIVRSAAVRVLHPLHPEVSVASLVVMAVTMVVNAGVSTYERRAGRRLGSDVLISDSAHTASDVLVSVSVLGTLVAARLGYPRLDTFMTFVVAGFIGRAAWQILRHAFAVLGDTVALPEASLRQVVLEVEGVLACDQIRSRGRPDDIKVDAVIRVDPALDVDRAHAIADAVEARVRASFPGVTDVVVHVEPASGRLPLARC